MINRIYATDESYSERVQYYGNINMDIALYVNKKYNEIDVYIDRIERKLTLHTILLYSVTERLFFLIFSVITLSLTFVVGTRCRLPRVRILYYHSVVIRDRNYLIR